MGTKPQSSGLFSKVAGIFRASDSGASGSADAESQQSVAIDTEKMALQALIKRKRQDDLVRRREFNYLRTLRKSPQGSSALLGEAGERISTFAPSSGYSADDRASTLKKIDAIEAHMISSWARSKVAAVVPPEKRGGIPAASGAPMFEYVPTEPAPLRTQSSSTGQAGKGASPAAPEEFDNMDLDFTGLLSTPGATAVDTWNAPESHGASLGSDATMPAPLRRAEAPAAAEYPAPDFPRFSASAKLSASATPTVAEPLPEHIESALQDAAIQFAEGDPAASEAVLLELMQASGISTATADVLASALFDLYRAIGQQDGFDVVAMDYAERFGRSPGEWFSLPEKLQTHAAVTSVIPVPAASMSETGKSWEAGSVLTAESVGALRKHFSAPNAVWHVDWLALNDIEPEAAPALAELMAQWCATPLDLYWSGIDSFLQALAKHTPADDNTADPLWWRLRMDALCILGRQDDFESLALDYCVVYEVSPPSWKNAACHFVQDTSPSGFGAMSDAPASVFGEDIPSLAGPYAACELVGEILGEAPEAMARLTAVGGSADHVVVSCALVMRMDFSAAGGVLNWAIDRQAKGCQVQFVQVPRLVAVFFQMLGIDRYAKISVRAN